MAHVMNYDEISKLKKGDIVYEELRETNKYHTRPLVFNGTDLTTNGVWWNVAEHYLLLCECDDACVDYNFHYRVWNEMPTREEMAESKWSDNPYAT